MTTSVIFFWLFFFIIIFSFSFSIGIQNWLCLQATVGQGKTQTQEWRWDPSHCDCLFFWRWCSPTVPTEVPGAETTEGEDKVAELPQHVLESECAWGILEWRSQSQDQDHGRLMLRVVTLFLCCLRESKLHAAFLKTSLTGLANQLIKQAEIDLWKV